MVSPTEWSTARFVVTTVVGLLTIAGAMMLLESLVPGPEPPERETTAFPDRPAPPLRPRVRRVAPDRVVIEFGHFGSSEITMTGDPEGTERFLACVNAAIEREFPAEETEARGGTATPALAGIVGWAKTQDRVNVITTSCLQDNAIATLPTIPPPPDAPEPPPDGSGR